MQLRADLIAPRCAVPIPYLGLTDEEARLGESLLRNLVGLEQQSNNLSAALALIETAETMPLAVPIWSSAGVLWRFIAFREGAMCLSNFYRFLKAARGLAGRVPTIAPLIDLPALRDAKNDFRTQFGKIERLRDTVAHPEFYPNFDMNMSGTPHPADHIVGRVTGSARNRTYFASIGGQMLSYDLTEQTAVFVAGLVRRVFTAFDRVTVEAVAQRRDQN